MRLKLFSKELFDGKKKLFSFAIASLIVYMLVGLQILLTTQKNTSVVTPDLLFYGQQYSDAIMFEKYDPIGVNFSDALEERMNKTVKSYELVERNIITVQRSNSLESITYSLFAASQDFFQERLSDMLSEGRLPAKGQNEVLIGGYMAKAFNIKVGDVITEKMVELSNIGQVSFVLDLSGSYEKVPYTVVGILNYTNGIFDYSAIVDSATQKLIKANTVWSYFTSKNGKDIYVNTIVNGDLSFLKEYSIGGLAENYQNKNENILTQMLKISYIFVLVMVLTYLMISYVLKGITRKLGILKALGISNRYIYQCYYRGVGVIQFISLICAYGFVHLVTKAINESISKSFGYDVYLYQVSMNTYIILGIMFVFITVAMLVLIHIKITRISPKVAMIS